MNGFVSVAMCVLSCFLFCGCGGYEDDPKTDDLEKTESTEQGDEHVDEPGDKGGDGGDTDQASAAIINKTCPIMEGDEAIDPEVTVAYMGKKVGFCCKKCIPKWTALSDAEKAAKLAQ